MARSIRNAAAVVALGGLLSRAQLLARRAVATADADAAGAFDETLKLPGDARSVPAARRWLAGLLAGELAAEDAVMCLSELAANAVLHSRSRRPGGTFSVRAAGRKAAIRVEVCDEGGPWLGPDGDHTRGRGLTIVAALASAWGMAGGTAGRMAWCEFTTGDPASAPADGSWPGARPGHTTPPP